MSYLRAILAFLLCTPALLLPYRPRVTYLRIVAFVFHAPFLLFGAIARVLLRELKLENRDG